MLKRRVSSSTVLTVEEIGGVGVFLLEARLQWVIFRYKFGHLTFRLTNTEIFEGWSYKVKAGRIVSFLKPTKSCFGMCLSRAPPPRAWRGVGGLIPKWRKCIEHTLQGSNISHLGKRKIIFKMPFFGDMLVPWRVYVFPVVSWNYGPTNYIFWGWMRWLLY